MTRKTVTIEEAGKVLGISRSLAYEAARRGELPTFRIGRRLLVPLSAIDRLLSDKKIGDSSTTLG
jgi:excisionase family DNA binding protein